VGSYFIESGQCRECGIRTKRVLFKESVEAKASTPLRCAKCRKKFSLDLRLIPLAEYAEVGDGKA
jgi:hypothetical protein